MRRAVTRKPIPGCGHRSWWWGSRQSSSEPRLRERKRAPPRRSNRERLLFLLRLLTAAVGTRPLYRDVRDHGESWGVSGPSSDLAQALIASKLHSLRPLG